MPQFTRLSQQTLEGGGGELYHPPNRNTKTSFVLIDVFIFESMPAFSCTVLF